MILAESVKEIVSKITKNVVDTIDNNSGLNTLQGWDSVNHVSIILDLEQHFDVSFDFDEFSELTDVNAIVISISKKLS